ncbi:hypothetical protein HMPREF1984_00058 [Leptotrichia sp. oral taxon 215 str. W9775]|jgi:hypothetical protein|uniref:DUF937 domain-containing protein n=1 Tax=Leptotrichia sp. oral taxon 215 TaxID=712359 RepID=UPI0003ADF8B5|nr:DUF937 domain-containing protein [Leptotrichia sp. oral taxon 215]ERK69081.1 hypothetical protein HMPREF1984_00058 [Leptotrichia sp. oral taxon 215 str. W9775]
MNLEALLGLLQGQDLGQLAEQVGGNEGQVKNGVMAALPAMLTALSKNTGTEKGAQELNNALETKHDGSILNNLSGYLSNPDLKDGAGILNHLFGSQTSNVANAVSQSSGLDSNGSMKMLQMLAPVLMGMLGQQKKQNNLDAEGIGNLTSMLASNFGSEAGASGIMEAVTNLLDANKDGNVMDDIMGMVGKLFGGSK